MRLDRVHFEHVRLDHVHLDDVRLDDVHLQLDTITFIITLINFTIDDLSTQFFRYSNTDPISNVSSQLSSVRSCCRMMETPGGSNPVLNPPGASENEISSGMEAFDANRETILVTTDSLEEFATEMSSSLGRTDVTLDPGTSTIQMIQGDLQNGSGKDEGATASNDVICFCIIRV